MNDHERRLGGLLRFCESPHVADRAGAARDAAALRWALAELDRLREAVAAEREACAALALADLEAGPGRVEAVLRFDNGRSEQAARRIAAAIRAREGAPS